MKRLALRPAIVVAMGASLIAQPATSGRSVERLDAALDAIVAHLRAKGVTSVYFSNDIDGTDASWADATGTPEPEGLEPDFVVALIRRLGAEIGMLGGDVMEVAPPLRDVPDKTVGLAVRYLRETLAAVLKVKHV